MAEVEDGPDTGSGFGPKLRSRKDGAAVPLDDLDKRLLNLMQGSFPIAPRPYQHVATEAGITEDEVLRARPAPARRAHHPPGHADLRHARARLQLDAGRRQGRSREPVARRQRDQRAPRRLPQLPAQPRVQHLVHDRDRAGLAARPRGDADALGELAGAESIRQLPTLKLFKIRMDLEMEKGTETLAKPAAEAVAPAETEPQPYDEFDKAVIRATQGDMPVDPGALRACRGRARDLPGAAARAPARGWPERRLLRRVAAILFHRRAGFSANGMGVWKVPDDRVMEMGMQMAAVPRDLALLPAPDLRGLAVLGLHDGPRALQGGVRRDPRLDRRGDRHHRARDALLLDRVQEDPTPVLHR